MPQTPVVHGRCLRAAVNILAMTCLGLTASADDSGWEPVKSRAGVNVLQKVVADSPFKATRGIMLSSAGLFDVLAVLKDVDACREWLHKCKHGEVVSQVSVGEHIYYTVIDSPLILKDRDTYIHSVVTYDADKKSLHIDMTGAENTAPPKKKRVRVLDFKGYWLIEHHDEDQIRLTYEVHMDPQVSTAGAANSNMVTSVLETLRSVDRLAQTRPYRNSIVPADSLNAITRSSAHP